MHCKGSRLEGRIIVIALGLAVAWGCAKQAGEPTTPSRTCRPVPQAATSPSGPSDDTDQSVVGENLPVPEPSGFRSPPAQADVPAEQAGPTRDPVGPLPGPVKRALGPSVPVVPGPPGVAQPSFRFVQPTEPAASRLGQSEPTGLPEDGSNVVSADRAIAAGAEPPAEPVVPRMAENPAVAQPAGQGYEVVTVYYGTDRAAISVGKPARRGALGWFALTAAAAGMTMVLSALMLRFGQTRALKIFTAGGVLLTVVLGVTTLWIQGQRGRSSGPGRVYGPGRGRLELGTCQVSIPARHTVGKIERPSVFRLELQEDPQRHMVLLDVQPEPAEAFFANLARRVQGSRRKEALVFIHGYNVTFQTAARRTAQMAYDLRFDGAPIFFSWPSQGNLLDYPVDEENAVWAVPDLKRFLLDVAQRSGARSVHVVAHSMGNRTLVGALGAIASQHRDHLPVFRQVVLTAPDIDAEIFQRDIAPAIVGTAERLTLYASSNDEALIWSKRFHGYARAGDSGLGLVVVPGVDTIDVSAVDTSLLGHFYYGSNRTVLADLIELLHESKPPAARRWLSPMPLGPLTYWVFRAEQSAVGAIPFGAPRR